MYKIPSSPTTTILFEKLSTKINNKQHDNKTNELEKENTFYSNINNNNNNSNHHHHHHINLNRNKLKQFSATIANKRRMNSSSNSKSRNNSLPISISNNTLINNNYNNQIKSNSRNSKKNSSNSSLLENKSSSLTSSFVSSSNNSLQTKEKNNNKNTTNNNISRSQKKTESVSSEEDSALSSSSSSINKLARKQSKSKINRKAKNKYSKSRQENNIQKSEEDEVGENDREQDVSIDYDENDLDNKTQQNLKEISDYLNILNNEYDEIKQQFITLNNQSLNYKKILGFSTPSPFPINNYQLPPPDPKYHFNLRDDETDKIRDILLKSNMADRLAKLSKQSDFNMCKDNILNQNSNNNNNILGTWLNNKTNANDVNLNASNLKRPNSRGGNNYNNRYIPNPINYFKDMRSFNDNSVHINYYTESKKYSKMYSTNDKYQVVSNLNKNQSFPKQMNQQTVQSNAYYDPIGNQLQAPIANYNSNINKLKSHYEDLKQKQTNQIIYSNLCNSNNNFKILVNSIDSLVKNDNQGKSIIEDTSNPDNKNNPLIIINKENVNSNKVIIEFTEASKNRKDEQLLHSQRNENNNSSHHFYVNDLNQQQSKKNYNEDYYSNYDYLNNSNNKIITPTNIRNKNSNEHNQSSSKTANDLINDFDKAMEEINSLLANRGSIKYPSNSLQNIDNTKTIETIRKLKVYSPNPNQKYSSIWKNNSTTANSSNSNLNKPNPPKNPKLEKINPLQVQSAFNNILSSNMGMGGNGQLYLQSTSFYTLNSSDYTDLNNQVEKERQVNADFFSNSNSNLSTTAAKPTTRLIAIFNRLNQKENKKKTDRRQSTMEPLNSTVPPINESLKKNHSNSNSNSINLSTKQHSKNTYGTSSSNQSNMTTNIISKKIITNVAQENWKNLVEENNSIIKDDKYKKDHTRLNTEHQNLILQKQQQSILHSQPTKLSLPNNAKL